MSDDFPYGADTIVIPITWANRPRARQLPWTRFGGRHVAANYDQSPLLDTIRAQISHESSGSPGAHSSVDGNIVPPFLVSDVAKDTPSDAPALDDNGVAIIGARSSPLRRPATLDPQMFVREGLKDKRIVEDLLREPDGDAQASALPYC